MVPAQPAHRECNGCLNRKDEEHDCRREWISPEQGSHFRMGTKNRTRPFGMRLILLGLEKLALHSGGLTFYHKTMAKTRFGDPNGIRTRVTAVKGRCPRPLDDRVTMDGQYPISIPLRKYQPRSKISRAVREVAPRCTSKIVLAFSTSCWRRSGLARRFAISRSNSVEDFTSTAAFRASNALVRATKFSMFGPNKTG